MAAQLHLVLALGLMLAMVAAADAADPAAGVYSGDGLRLELTADDTGNFTGTVASAQQSMPLAARRDGAVIVGTFEAGGSKFQFRATTGDGGLEFVTDNTRYKLAREQAKNPLAGNATAPPVDAKPSTHKDPLAYRVLQLPGGTVAKFDNWTYGQIQGDANVAWCDAFPHGRQQDFVLRAYVGTPTAQDMANLFEVGPKYAQALLAQLFGPALPRSGEGKKTTCGGDAAMVETYAGSVMGKAVSCQVMYVKRKDVAVAVMGIGTEQGFKEFGRAVEIVAQSITLKESAIEPGLVGTWVIESYRSAGVGPGSENKINLSQSRSITIFPNGTFSDTARTGFSGQDATGLASGGSRGSTVKRGNVLSFKYDDGQTWSAAYELHSNGLKLDGKIYLKQ